MRQTDLTYGQLDKVLNSLGFSLRRGHGDPPSRVYDHKESGASFILPGYQDGDRVFEHHLVGARTTVDRFGVADPETFDAELRKCRSNGRQRVKEQ
jgi:hypothetical protein